MTHWTRLSPLGDKCATRWRHASGWEVRHCGHPTANWPYYLLDPKRLMVVSFNGLGFKSLAIARTVVEQILAGSYRITGEDCEENIARVDNVTAFGQRSKYVVHEDGTSPRPTAE